MGVERGGGMMGGKGGSGEGERRGLEEGVREWREAGNGGREGVEKG